MEVSSAPRLAARLRRAALCPCIPIAIPCKVRLLHTLTHCAAMEGCGQVVFMPFAAGDSKARAPCVVTAADGSRILRLPVPLAFTTNPTKFSDSDLRTLCGELEHC